MVVLPSGGQRIVSSRNILLGQLSPADRTLIDPLLHAVVMKQGDVLIRPDDPLDSIYFLDAGIISVEERIGRRLHLEIAVVGYEGLLGWPVLLGCQRSCHLAVVQSRDCAALRIGSEDYLLACSGSPTLRTALLSFVQTVILQMARTIASHLDHSLDQNLARWLLMRHDRVSGDEMFIRHEEIADALGVRRASITDSLHVLEGLRLIRCTRGRLTVRSRSDLEGLAGEAYGQAEAQYRTMIAPFGKSGGAPKRRPVSPAQVERQWSPGDAMTEGVS